MVVPRHLIVQILTPCIEHASLDLVALNHVGQVDVVVPEGKWLQRVDVPLMQSNLLTVAAQFVTDDAERLQLVVTALIEARVLVQFSERLVHLVSLVLQNELIEDLARQDLGLPPSLIIYHAPIVGLVAHSFVEDYRQLLHSLIQILSICLDSSNLRSQVDVGVVQGKIFCIEILNVARVLFHFSNDIVEYFSKLIQFLKRFHQIGLNIVVLKDQILLVCTRDIKPTTHVGCLSLLSSHFLLEVLVVLSCALQVFLHCLIGHVDFVFLIRDALQPFVVYFDHSELANEIIFLPFQLLHIVIHAVESPLQRSIVHHHGFNAIYVELVSYLGADGDHLTYYWLWRRWIVLHCVQSYFGCRRHHEIVFVWRRWRAVPQRRLPLLNSDNWRLLILLRWKRHRRTHRVSLRSRQSWHLR